MNTNLLLIDSRIQDINIIIESLLLPTDYIIFDYNNDTLDTLQTKINNLNKKYINIGIFQENYNLNTYQFINSFENSILSNVEVLDPILNTWNTYKELILYFKTALNITNIDLFGCNILINNNWKYVINTLSTNYNITIQSSNDLTGSTNFDGDWILESNNEILIGKYFTPNILNWNHILIDYYNIGHSCIILNNGQVVCVGRNDFGQLGNGNTTQQQLPVYMMLNTTTNITNVKSISCGNAHTCILLQTGEVLSCGYNVDGQFGNNTSNALANSTPVYMINIYNTGNLEGVSAI